MLLLHALHEVLYRDIPIHLIGVGHEQTGDGGCVVALLGTERGVAQQNGHNGTVEHEFSREGTSQSVCRTALRDGQSDRLLTAVLDMPE